MAFNPLAQSSRALLGALALTSLLLGGCHSRQQTELESGTYVATVGTIVFEEQFDWHPEASLVLDMDALEATFEIAGSKQRLTLMEGDGRALGCASHYELEWVRIGATTLTIEDVTFRMPVLFADCGAQPPRVVLNEGVNPPSHFSLDATPMISLDLR